MYYVQLWRDINVGHPTVCERVQAASEGHAVVQVMRRHHMIQVDRAWVSRSALEAPTIRLVHVFVKGGVRRWKHELPAPAARGTVDRSCSA